MFGQMKDELLVTMRQWLSDDQLLKLAQSLDMMSNLYSVARQSTSLSVVGRSQIMDLIKMYLIVRHTQGLSNGSMKTMGNILRKWCYTTDLSLKQLTANSIRGWLFRYQQNTNISNRTLDLYRNVVCGFVKWCHLQGYIDKNPAECVKPIKYSQKPRKALTQLQLQKLRSVCRSQRDKCIIEVLYSTGCRVSQLVNIKLSDINWQTSQITVLGKGSKYRTVYINAKAQFAMKQYLKRRTHQSEYLLTSERKDEPMTKASVQRVFTQLSALGGFAKGTLTPHIMRHTMATQAITVCSAEQVQQMLGHSNVATTMIYAQVRPESIKAAHKISVV